MTDDEQESIETLRREINRTISNPTHITLTREDAANISHLIHDLSDELKNAMSDFRNNPAIIGPSIVLDEGQAIRVPINFGQLVIPAQAAYDLHQSIGRTLSSLVQPFKPWPREEES